VALAARHTGLRVRANRRYLMLVKKFAANRKLLYENVEYSMTVDKSDEMKPALADTDLKERTG